MKWLPGENDLVKEQSDFRKQVWSESRNLYICGFPGSGKSVCMLYAIKTIRDKDPNAKIVFVEYTHALIKMIQAAITELGLDDIPVVTYRDFKANYIGPYDFIICDEVQDATRSLLSLMKQRAKRVIVGGDHNQSIYDTVDEESTIEPNDIISILSPITTQLTILHRLNKYVIRCINSFMPQMRMLAEKSSMLKKHKPVYVWMCSDFVDEVSRIMSDANEALNYGESVAILFPTHKDIKDFVSTYLSVIRKPVFEFPQNKYGKPDYDQLNRYFKSNGIRIQSITNGAGSLVTDSDKIILSTYHSSKGLDFDKVFMPACNAFEYDSDPRLFMVAMSRSRKDLILSYTKTPNKYIQKFIDNREACQFVDFVNPTPINNQDDDW